MKLRLIVVAVVAVAAVLGAAYATIPNQSGAIHGCYAGGNGDLRVVETAAGCRRNETALEWSQAGSVGPGLASIDELKGARCKGVRGKLATVRVDYGSGFEAPL